MSGFEIQATAGQNRYYELSTTHYAGFLSGPDDGGASFHDVPHNEMSQQSWAYLLARDCLFDATK